MNFNGISYTFTTPYNPATNSQAECTVHGFKEAIKVKVNGTLFYIQQLVLLLNCYSNIIYEHLILIKLNTKSSVRST